MLMILSSASSSLLLSHSIVYFFTSFIVFCSSVASVWYFLLFSITYLKFSMFIHSSKIGEDLMTSLSGDLLVFISVRFFFSLGFYLVLLFGTCSFVSSFCLTQFHFLKDIIIFFYFGEREKKRERESTHEW